MRCNDDKNHVMLKYGQQFGTLCQPIFATTPINYIGLARIYHDNSRSYLISNPEWGEVLLSNNYHLAGTEDALVQTEPGSVQLWSLSNMFALNQQTKNLFKECNDAGYGNGVTLIERNEHFTEFFHICAKGGHESVNPFLEHNIDRLWNTILFLKESIYEDKELKQAYNTKYQYDTVVDLTQELQVDTHRFNQSFGPQNKFYLGGYFGDVSFTRREIECLKLLYQNYSAKEQAKMLSLSFRTIETYIETIKRKVNCSSQLHLVIELSQNNAFKSLMKHSS